MKLTREQFPSFDYNKMVNRLNVYSGGIVFFSFIGILLSLYAIHIGEVKALDPDYTAMCDIDTYMSCSKVLTSRWSKGFGITINGKPIDISNSLFGLIFYTTCSIMAMMNGKINAIILYGITVMGVLMSFYLGYLLVFVIFDFCIVCVATYLVNFILNALAYYHMNQMENSH